MDYADLAIIDLSKADTAEGYRELAMQARDAMTSTGFFYVVNHGSSLPQVRVQSLRDDLLPNECVR